MSIVKQPRREMPILLMHVRQEEEVAYGFQIAHFAIERPMREHPDPDFPMWTAFTPGKPIYTIYSISYSFNHKSPFLGMNLDKEVDLDFVVHRGQEHGQCKAHLAIRQDRVGWYIDVKMKDESLIWCFDE